MGFSSPADKGLPTVISKCTNCVRSELLSANAFFLRTECQGVLCEPGQAALFTLAPGLPIGQNIRLEIRHHLDLIFVGMDVAHRAHVKLETVCALRL